MESRVRFAQIGVDHPHAAGFRESLLSLPEIQVVALYDPDPDEATFLIEDSSTGDFYRQLPLYDDLAELLQRERPEAVLITLPNDVTPDAIVECAQAGAHVYAEKPCARTAGEFQPALKAVRQAGVQFTTGYLRRSSPMGQAIREYVHQGLLGQLISMEARWITTSVAVRDPGHFLFSRDRSGGGILHWLGCHWIDFMRWATSAEAIEVLAVLDTLSGEPIGVEDAAVVALRYQGGYAQAKGMLASLHCSYVTDEATDQLFFGLRGTTGWAVWEKSGPELIVHSTHESWRAAPTRVLRYELDLAGGYGGGQGVAALKRFIASFRRNATPLFTVEDALCVLEVLDAAHGSAALGRRVKLKRAQGEDRVDAIS